MKLMRFITIFLLFAILCTSMISMVACTDTTPNTPVENPLGETEKAKIVEGVVLSVTSKTIIFAPADKNVSNPDKISVNNIDNQTFRVGDKITVIYKGEIAETYPAQITDVIGIINNSNNLTNPIFNGIG